MTQPEPHHALSPSETAGLEMRLYEFNRFATGRDDGQGLTFVTRDGRGHIIGAAAGYSWAGIAELRQMWVAEAHRGQKLGRDLLKAFVDEAAARGVSRIWVASFDFQAPAFYERYGFKRIVELDGFPEGHRNVILCFSVAD